jgi:hypothetical protein
MWLEEDMYVIGHDHECVQAISQTGVFVETD